MVGTCKTLTFEEIVGFNRKFLNSSGELAAGSSPTLINPGSLHYIVEAVQGFVFGREMFPSIEEKAAAYCWHVNRGHVFLQGNKRTGMFACQQMLAQNLCQLDFDKDLAIAVLLAIARNEISFEHFTSWVKERTIELVTADGIVPTLTVESYLQR